MAFGNTPLYADNNIKHNFLELQAKQQDGAAVFYKYYDYENGYVIYTMSMGYAASLSAVNPRAEAKQ